MGAARRAIADHNDGPDYEDNSNPNDDCELNCEG